MGYPEICVVVHYPRTAEGRRELAERAAEVHAEAVISRIKGLNCPSGQKESLLGAVIGDARARAKASRGGETYIDPPPAGDAP